MRQSLARLGGVSAIALMASAFGADVAAACTATAQTTTVGLIVTTSSVSVDCDVVVDTRLFDTGFAGFTDLASSFTYNAYDGAGNDTMTLSVGAINTLAGTSPPRLTNTAGSTSAFLNAQTAFVSMGAGNDTVNMVGGTISGDLLLSDGDDTADIVGGTITGALFGDDAIAGNDTITVGGGPTVALIGGTVFAGGGNDTVFIRPNSQIGTSAGEVDSVGLEEGNDTFVMTGGTLAGGVSGGDGDDSLSVGGGSVDFVAGGLGVDTIDIFGTANVGDIVTAEDGDDIVTVRGGNIVSFLDLGTGGDSLAISAGAINGGVLGGDGNDSIGMTGGTVTNNINGNNGNDVIAISGGTTIAGADVDINGRSGEIRGNDGDDTITISGTADIAGDVEGNVGNDTIIVSGGTIRRDVQGNEGDDSITILGGTIVESVNAGGTPSATEVNSITISGGTIGGVVWGAEGADTVNISGGTIGSSTETFAGNDSVFVTGGSLVDIDVGVGNDIVRIGGGTVLGTINGDDGDDDFAVTAGTVNAGLVGDAGNDTIVVSGTGQVQVGFAGAGGNDTLRMDGGFVSGIIDGDGIIGDFGNDTITVTAGTLNGLVFGDAGNDTIAVSGGDISGYTQAEIDTLFGVIGPALDDPGSLSVPTVSPGETRLALGGGVGDDSITVSGGTIGGGVDGGDDNDTISVAGGTINGNVIGGAGTDVVTVSGGTITGGVNAETVHLLGGAIGGDITGLTGNTLVIQSGTALTLSNGVLFQGTNAVGTLTASDLARSGGPGAFQSQVFSGFTSLSLDGSTLGFTANQGIGALSLVNGSTLFVNGQVNLLSPAGGAGSLSITNSAINFINGSPTDRLNAGAVSLNGATIGLDVNQGTAQADQLVTSGAFSATGANVVLVNLIGTPQFGTLTILPVGGEAVPTTGTGSPLFTVTGLPQTPGALFTYDIITGANGGLYLRAQSTDVATPEATRVAIDSMPLETATRSLLDIGNDAIITELGLAVSGSRSDAAPAFGIYSSGQLAHVEHDGFDISGDGFSGVGPSFSSNDFSAAASVELDAAKYWGFDNQYGLNIGLFGGYASTEVRMDPTPLFASVGNASNESGMIGAYSLFREGTNYALVAATGFFGNTDVNNDVLNATGGYSTAGYAVTGSAGHIFALGDRFRLDLRGGVLGAIFEGDAFTDSTGVDFGKSRISFGAVKFEPGIYGDFRLDSGIVASPYARMELQQRFGYQNTGSIQGVKLNFDDSDFSAAFSGGVNLQVSKSTTVSSEIRTKLSADSQTFAGKLGIKVKF